MKLERHRKILELINTYDIETQEELADLLNNQGYNVTQATVSRDIRQLKLIKKNINGKQKYAVIQGNINDMNEKYIRVLKDGFVSMAMAQNILVIKTVSGMAMAVAAALDAMKWKEIVGCIAGDDAAPDGKEDTRRRRFYDRGYLRLPVRIRAQSDFSGYIQQRYILCHDDDHARDGGDREDAADPLSGDRDL